MLDQRAEAEDIARKIVEAFLQGDAEPYESIIAEQARYEGPRMEGLAGLLPQSGRATFIQRALAFRHLLDNARAEIACLIVDGDRLSVTIDYSGIHARPYLGIAPTGRACTLRTIDILRLRDGKIHSISQSAGRFELVDALSAGHPAALPLTPVQAEEVAHFAPGSFPECIVAAEDGTFYVSLQFQHQIVRVRPDGETELFHAFAPELVPGFFGGPACLALTPDGALLVNLVSEREDIQGVWRFSTRTAEGQRLASVPVSAQPNGLALDEAGRIYVADSKQGLIWRICPGETSASIWCRDQLLAARPFFHGAPATNGIQMHDGRVYASISDTGLLVGIAILPDGKPGLPQIVAEDLPADDFAVDAEGDLFVTTHIHDSIVKVDKAGTQTLLATATEGVVGPTYACFGRRQEDAGWLYVACDGGLLTNDGSSPLRPNIVRLRIR